MDMYTAARSESYNNSNDNVSQCTSTTPDKPRIHLVRVAGTFAWALAYNSLNQGTNMIALPSEAKRLSEHNASMVTGGIGAAGSLATLLGLVTNALGDGPLASRFGRRRPFVLVAAIVAAMAAAAWVVGDVTSSLAFVAVSYVGMWAAMGVGWSALQALIPDTLPSSQHGAAGGIVGLYSVLGSAVGYGLFSAGASVWVTVAIMGCLSLSLAVPTVLCAKEYPVDNSSEGCAYKTRAQRAIDTVRGFAFHPTQHVDWVLLLVIRFGFYVAMGCASFMQYWIADMLRLAEPEQFVGNVGLATLGIAIVAALPVGFLSDKVGRKPFLMASTLLMVGAMVLWATVESEAMIWVSVLVYGLGNGIYNPVETAMACDSLPASKDAGKHMAVFTVAATLAQLLSQLLDGVLLAQFSVDHPHSSSSSGSSSEKVFEQMYERQGYRILFFISAGFCLMSFVASCAISPARAKRAQQAHDERDGMNEPARKTSDATFP
eukprot:m51a1_g3088 hypothetical protein (489) ;mRNA; r:82739-84307